MKLSFSVLVIFVSLIAQKSMAYDIYWVKGEAKSSDNENQTIITHGLSGIFTSNKYPSSKAVSIINLEVIEKKNHSKVGCSDIFFPYKEMGIINIEKESYDGVKVVRGFWEKAFKYVVVACSNTENGYKTSTSFLRLPFLKKTLPQSLVFQLSFLSKEKKTDFETVFIKFFNSIDKTFFFSHAKASGFDEFNDNLETTNENLSNINDTINAASGNLTQQSKEWQSQSEKWQTHSSKWQEIARDFMELGENQSDKWIEQSEKWRKDLNRITSPGSLFKAGLATAVGATLGSFGMNMVLNGITSGFDTLISEIKKKKSGIDISKLKEHLIKLERDLEKMEAQLDKIVMALPIINFYNESESIRKLKTKKILLESNNRKFTDDLDIASNLECREKLAEQIVLNENNLNLITFFLELASKSNFQFCKNLNNIFDHWKEANNLVWIARSELLAKEGRKSFLKELFQIVGKNTTKADENPLDEAKKVASMIRLRLKEDKKKQVASYKKSFRGAQVAVNECESKYCNKQYSDSNASCTMIYQHLMSGTKKVLPNVTAEMLSLLSISSDEYLGYTKQQKVSLFKKWLDASEAKCFRNWFKKNNNPLKKECGDDFIHVENFEDLVECSSNYKQKKDVYAEIQKKQKSIENAKLELDKAKQKSGVDPSGNMAAYRSALDEMDKLEESYLSHVESRMGLSKDKEKQYEEMYKKHCEN